MHKDSDPCAVEKHGMEFGARSQRMDFDLAAHTGGFPDYASLNCGSGFQNTGNEQLDRLLGSDAGMNHNFSINQTEHDLRRDFRKLERETAVDGLNADGFAGRELKREYRHMDRIFDQLARSLRSFDNEYNTAGEPRWATPGDTPNSNYQSNAGNDAGSTPRNSTGDSSNSGGDNTAGTTQTGDTNANTTKTGDTNANPTQTGDTNTNTTQTGDTTTNTTQTAPDATSNNQSTANDSAPNSQTGSDGGNQSPPQDNTTTGGNNTIGDGSGFQIQNGQLRVNGKLLSGVAVTGEYAQQVGATQLADQISSQFPGINVVRLATSPEGGAFTNGSQLNGGETVQNIDQVIQALNAKGIAVVVDNHGSDANTQNNVSQNGNEAAWFAQIAKDNLGNNMVMFQTENEPMGSDSAVEQEQQAAYQAIRATGSNAVVAFDLVGGGSASPMQNDPSTYNADTNYVIDAHSYASDSSDPASALQQEIAQTSMLHEANGGAVPVYIGETGDSISGSAQDAAWQQELNAVWSDGTGGIAWLYDGAATGFNGNDHLTDSNGNLTPYGQYVQSLINKGAS